MLHPSINLDRAIQHVAENQVREAMQRGQFDDLPGAGSPLPDIDEAFDPNWWVRKWMRRERLKQLDEQRRRFRKDEP